MECIAFDQRTRVKSDFFLALWHLKLSNAKWFLELVPLVIDKMKPN